MFSSMLDPRFARMPATFLSVSASMSGEGGAFGGNMVRLGGISCQEDDYMAELSVV